MSMLKDWREVWALEQTLLDISLYFSSTYIGISLAFLSISLRYILAFLWHFFVFLFNIYINAQRLEGGVSSWADTTLHFSVFLCIFLWYILTILWHFSSLYLGISLAFLCISLRYLYQCSKIRGRCELLSRHYLTFLCISLWYIFAFLSHFFVFLFNISWHFSSIYLGIFLAFLCISIWYLYQYSQIEGRCELLSRHYLAFLWHFFLFLSIKMKNGKILML